MLTFDITEIPFSTRGSWLDLSPVIGLHRTAPHIHLVSHQNGIHPILALIPERLGAAVETTVTATPSVLRWSTEDGCIEATFETADTLRLRGSGAGLRLEASSALTPFTGGYLFQDPLDGSAVLTSYETGRRYRITRLSGDMTVEGSGVLGMSTRAITLAASQDWEIALEEFRAARAPYEPSRSFSQASHETAAAFADYRATIHPGAETLGAKAAYVLWSATVAPMGYVTREAVLMSKHWMDKVWSWDHCFNAIALAAADPKAALDQFLLVFDHQDDSGALPDSITHSEVLYNFVKPPIHGWAFRRIRERAGDAYTRNELLEVYTRLAKWTDFWLIYRRAPGHPLPYYQHGNDSGWDNSTAFDADRVIESPDLAAFLILQARTLAGLADELGDTQGRERWSQQSSGLEEALLGNLWDGKRFVARSPTGGDTDAGSSLLTKLPIILGASLPRDIAQCLAVQIVEHLTEWGLATELPLSEQYENDGYWRGPIWAPSTILIVDGLRRAGYTDLAVTIANSFLRLCQQGGFAENFDALTGQGLRDRAYTWTAAAYLMLSSDRSRQHLAPDTTLEGILHDHD